MNPSVSIPFAGESYTDKTLNANCQRSVNLYPMRTKASAGSDKTQPYAQPNDIVMYPTPGYLIVDSTSSFGAIRGIISINNVIYIIYGNQLYTFTPRSDDNSNLGNGTFSVVGTLITSIGRCFVECNTNQLVISDGQYGYTYNLTTGIFAQISTSGAFPINGVTNLAFLDGYILAAINNSKTVIQSNLLDGSLFDVQAFDTITTFSDNIVAVFSDGSNLYVFGPKITEVQSDGGTIPYAFAKIPNVLLQVGCAAKATILRVGNTIMWLGSDAANKAFVVELNGYNPQTISTPPINEIFERYSVVNDAFAFTYKEGDNRFYAVTFPSVNDGLGATWVYDTTMKMWHERESTIDGKLGRDLPNFCILWQGHHVIADFNNNLCYMSQDYPTDNGTAGNPLVRTRTCQHLNAEGMTLFINELFINIEAGTGVGGNAATFYPSYPINYREGAISPLATLEVSKDFGNTWINVGTRSMGVQGQYLKRLIWRNLGRFRQNATFRLTITDSVRTYITGAKAKIKVGNK